MSRGHSTSLSDVLSAIVPRTASFHPEQLVTSSHLKELKSSIHYGRVDPRTWHEAGSGRSLLHYAAASNQVETIQFLIEECKVSLNLQDSNGDTALHLAVTAGHMEATDAILMHGADDTIRNTKEHPPLHTAIKQNSNKIVSKFAEHAHVNLFVRGYHEYSSLHIIAEMNNLGALEVIYEVAMKERRVDGSIMKSYLLAGDGNGLTAFHIAARAGSFEVLEFLLSKTGACDISPSDLQASITHDGRSAFHYAIERGQTGCAEILLKYGADPATASGIHPPPLHVACSHGKLSILIAMVEAQGKGILQACDYEGGTALHSSTSSIRSKELISYLVENGVCINDVDSNGFSALSNAIQLGSLNAVDGLLTLGADPLIKDKWGCNSLHRAVLGKRMEVFKKLIGCGVTNVMAASADNSGHYPIHDALELGLSEMVAVLLDMTAEEFRDAEGSNYMHLAASSGDEKTLTHLLGKPSAHHMINEANSAGSTPLHFATLGSSIATVRKLLDYGAVIHKDNDGHTPFMCACSVGNLEAAKLLYSSNKFQRDWVDLCGCTSLHFSVDGGNPEVITFCLDEGMAITFDDYQLTFFDKILDRCDEKLAVAALSHKRWEECVDVSSPDKPHPILRIIDRIPKVYGTILDHCYTHCSLDRTHSEYWEEFNFKCLSLKREPPGPVTDQKAEHVSSKRDGIEIIDLEDYDAVHTQLHTENDVTQAQRSFTLRSAQRRQELFNKKSRVMGNEQSLAVVRKLLKARLVAYLLHPVVKAFISMKWAGFGVFFQLGIMFFHFLLALFFSVFVVAVGPPSQNSSLPISVHNGSGELESDYNSISTSSEVLLTITLVLSLLNLLIFFLQAYIHGLDLLFSFLSSIQIWLNFGASFCILLFLSSVLVKELRGALWNSAALGVFLSWFSFGISLQLINVFSIGVYLTMLLSTTKLFVKVLTILMSFLFAFAFAFYILVGTVDGLQYTSIGLSLFSNLHSLVAVTDYLGFVSIEQSDRFRFDIAVFTLLVVLIVLVPIVAINLLIGLAVGDIAAIQKDATISHLEVEVRALASLDKRLLPHRFTKHISKATHRQHPNKKLWKANWLAKLFHNTVNDKVHTDTQQEEMRKSLQEEVDRKQRGSSLVKLQEGIEQLAVDQRAQVEGMKRLEALVAKLVDAQGVQEK